MKTPEPSNPAGGMSAGLVVGQNGQVADDEVLEGARPTDLFGRATELQQLADIADLAVEATAQMAVVSGEAGIGKTSLLAEFFDALKAAGWSTHVGHCIEFADRPLPFGPIVSILRSVLLSDLENVDGLTAYRRTDLAGLLPELSEPGSDRLSLVGDVDRLFDAVAATLVEAARPRPLAVLVEDIHWADAATRDLLASMVRVLGDARVLFVITERTGATSRDHPLRTWLAEHRRLPNVRSIELSGLSREAVGEQAEVLLGEVLDAQTLDELLERTRGNPYYSAELLAARRQGEHALPTSLADFLTSRIDRLADDQREVLRAMAVAGGAVSHARLVAMLPDLSLRELVRGLFDASILALEGSDYVFGHALLREAILRDLLPFELEDLHRVAAEAILADPGRQSSLSDLASLAVHWDGANDADKSLAAAAVAADAAAAVAAYEAAAEMSLQALRAWPGAENPDDTMNLARDQLLLQAADYLGSCHRGADAIELITEALAGWARDLPAARRALLLANLGPLHWHFGEPAETSRVMARSRELIGDDATEAGAQVHNRLSKQALADGHIHPALSDAERAIEIAVATGPKVVLIEAMTTKALAIGVTGDLAEGIALACVARELALAEGHVSLVANTYRTEMLVIAFQDGRTEECMEASRQGLAFAELHCGPRMRAEFRLSLCHSLVEAGRFREATPLLAELLGSEMADLRRLAVIQAAALHALATDALEDARVHLMAADELASRYQSAQETGFQARLWAELYRREGRLIDALGEIDDALDLQLAGDNLTYTRESIVEKIRVVRALYRAEHPAAGDQFIEVERLVAGFDGVGKANEAVKALMELELSVIGGELDHATAAATLTAVESAGYLGEMAQARLLLLEVAVTGRTNDTEVAEEIRSLHSLAEEHGMAFVARGVAAVAALARVSVAAPEPVARASSPTPLPHHLTTREVEVMSLLAEGLTNKAIGELLFVSPRTVGTHVSNLLAKVGATNRGEAAAAYHRLNLAEIIDLRDTTDQSAATGA